MAIADGEEQATAAASDEEEQAPAAAGVLSSTCALLSELRISSNVAIKPTTAKAAPTRKADWKPSVSTTGSCEEPMIEFATAARIARPSAPPTCSEVLIRPLANPCSRSSIPETAAIVNGTNASPSPTAASNEGPRMSPTKLP